MADPQRLGVTRLFECDMRVVSEDPEPRMGVLEMHLGDIEGDEAQSVLPVAIDREMAGILLHLLADMLTMEEPDDAEELN